MNQPIRSRLMIRLWLPACLMMFGLQVFAQEAIRVGGTGAGTILMQHLIDVYLNHYPNRQVSAVMPPMGSGGGLRALSAGAIQVAIISLPPAPEESASFEITPWLTTPLVFTGKNVASGPQLTVTTVSDIFSGQTTRWADGTAIRIILRSERETDTKRLRAYASILDTAITNAHRRLGIIVADNDVENLTRLEQTPGSFGTVALGQLLLTKSPLKAAMFEGTPPSSDTLSKGTYRLEKPFYLISARNPNPATQEFIKFLQSQDALRFAMHNGFIPLKP